MSSQIDQITQFLFETDSLEEISLDQLRQLVEEFPSFNAGHYLLTQKLQDLGLRELETEVQKTVLYFHNPFWLRWLLDRAKAETPSEISTLALETKMNEEPVQEKAEFESNREEVILVAETVSSSNISIESQEDAPAEPFTITEIISRFENELKEEQQFNRIQSAEIEQVQAQEEPLTSTGEDISVPVTEYQQEVPHFMRPEDQFYDLQEVNPDNNGNAYSKNKPYGPIAEWQEKQAAEFESRRIPEEETLTSLEQNDNKSSEEEFSSEPLELNSSAEIHRDSPLQGSSQPEPQFIEEEMNKEEATITQDGLNEAEAGQPESLESFEDFDEEEESQPSFKRPYFFWEKEFYGNQAVQDQPSENIETENDNVESDSGRVPDQVSGEERTNVIKEERADEVPLFFDAGPPAPAIEEPVAETLADLQVMPQASEELPSLLSSVLEKEMEQVGAQETELSFQPYHTVDYFASQGIRFVQEENPTDKFGKQLKSFTAWLKSMKRLPQAMMETEMSATAEAAIQSIAQHSLDEKEVVTEAMAEVLFLQGMHEKAIKIYDQLSLLDPSKNTYFAAKIEEIKSHLI